MKKLIFSTIASITMSLGAVSIVSATPVHHASLPLSYKAVYCYPTGSYWVTQLSNPNNTAYYAANNAYYTSQFGAGSIYC